MRLELTDESSAEWSLNGETTRALSGGVDFTECDGESCDLSVKFPTLAIRLPGTKMVERELRLALFNLLLIHLL